MDLKLENQEVVGHFSNLQPPQQCGSNRWHTAAIFSNKRGDDRVDCKYVIDGHFQIE